MNLMLAGMFACIVVGLISRKPGRWQHLVVVFIAVTMTGLYYFARRFM